MSVLGDSGLPISNEESSNRFYLLSSFFVSDTHSYFPGSENPRFWFSGFQTLSRLVGVGRLDYFCTVFSTPGVKKLILTSPSEIEGTNLGVSIHRSRIVLVLLRTCIGVYNLLIFVNVRVGSFNPTLLKEMRPGTHSITQSLRDTTLTVGYRTGTCLFCGEKEEDL